MSTTTKTVWVCASTPDDAIFALLDGHAAYETAELAVRVTGRLPVEVQIGARVKEPWEVQRGLF